MLNVKTSKGVAPETATEAWRLLSADIAWKLWSNPNRKDQPLSASEPASAWEELASKFRQRVRMVLRKLEAEGIRFERRMPDSLPPLETEEWRLKTARIAWMLWLHQWRESNERGGDLEKQAWERDAKGYRSYVRSACKALHADGIRLV